MTSLHHIGVACNSIDNDVEIYFNFGFKVESTFEDTEMKVRGLFLTHMNFPRIELLENFGGNVLDSWLNSGSPMYHLGVSCSKEEFEELRKLGHVVKQFDVSKAFPGKTISFVIYKGRRLMEFIY